MSEISQTDTILEANNFIVLEKYVKSVQDGKPLIKWLINLVSNWMMVFISV